MLIIQPTEMMTGVRISGDYWDIDALLTAIYTVTGEKNRYLDFQGARHRILRVCLDLRKATKGEKNIEFVSNGIYKTIEKEKNILAPKKNVYFSVEVFMPEIIFTAIALNDFITLHQEKADHYEWSPAIATIRHFQATVYELLESLLDKEHYGIFLEMLHTKQPAFFRYATQYVDVLNLEYLHLSRDERREHLAAYALRFFIEDDTYTMLKEQIMSAASFTKQPLHEIETTLKYPDIIDW